MRYGRTDRGAAPTGVLQLVADLVLELVAPDALPAGPRARRVPALHHEVLDAAVERHPVVVLRRAQGDEVLARAAGAQVENESKT